MKLTTNIVEHNVTNTDIPSERLGSGNPYYDWEITIRYWMDSKNIKILPDEIHIIFHIDWMVKFCVSTKGGMIVDID